MATDSEVKSNSSPSHPAELPGAAAGIFRSIGFIFAVLFSFWVYAIYRLGTLWHAIPDYNFGWLVPPLCLALFWERWKCRPPQSQIRPSQKIIKLWGGLALALFCGAIFLDVVPGWRFAGWLFALSVVGITMIVFYFLGGQYWVRHLSFPILFFLVAVPWPLRFEAPLIDHLSQINAITSTALANLLGTPCMRHGSLIETGAGYVGVDDACSGIRSFQAAIMVAFFLGELFRFRLINRTLLIFGGIGLALACNVARTTYLVLTCDLLGLATVNLRHDPAGFAILVVTLVGLLAFAWLLSVNKIPKPTLPFSHSEPAANAKTPPPLSRSNHREQNISANLLSPNLTKALLALLLWIAGYESGMTTWFAGAEKSPPAAVSWTFRFPVQNSSFSQMQIPDSIQKMLSYDEGKQAEWRDDNGHFWQLYYFCWLPTNNRYRAMVSASAARSHAPDLCLRNAGMILQTNLGTKVIARDDVRLRVTTEKFLDRGRNFYVLAGYWEPRLHPVLSNLEENPSTTLGLRMALRAILDADRGRSEKRVIKIGVWDMETDEQAASALEDCINHIIAR